MSKVVYDKDKNQHTLVEASDCRVYARHLNDNSKETITLPSNSIIILYGINTYNAGFVYIVQTGAAQGIYKITPIVQTSYTSVEVNGMSLVITTVGAVTELYYQKLGII